MDACRQCHRHITDHPADTYEHGWFVKSHQDPCQVAVLIHTATLGHAYVLLGDDGMVQLAPWPETASGDPFELPALPRGTSAAPDTAA